MPTSSGSPHSLGDNDPSCVPGFCQISEVTLFVLELSTCQPVVHSCALSQVLLCFKTHFRSPGQRLHWSSGGGSPCAVAGAGLSQETVPWTAQQFRVYGKLQHIVSARDCCPQPVYFFYTGELGSLMVPADEAYHPMHSKQVNHFSRCDPGDPQAACGWESALLSDWSTAQISAMSQTSATSDSAPLFIENWPNRNPLLFPHQWFWGTVFLCRPLHVFSLSLFLLTCAFSLSSFSLATPSMIRALSPGQQPWLFLGCSE